MLACDGDGDGGRGRDPLRLVNDELTDVDPPPELWSPPDPPSEAPRPGETDLNNNNSNQHTTIQ